MTFRHFTDYLTFSRHVVDFLLREEAVNSILLSMIYDTQCSFEQPGSDMEAGQQRFKCTVDADKTPRFVASRRDGFHLVLYGDGHPDVVDRAVDGILEHIDDLKGVIGPRSLAEKFTDKYGEVSGLLGEVEMDQLIYEILEVNETTPVPGTLRVADSADTPLLVEWMTGFQRDIGTPRTLEHVRDRVLGMIARKSAYLWEVQGPVAMAIHSRSSRSCAAVSGVYTPPHLRGRGYATACVSALVKRLFAAGFARCCLYTDANFPTSNRIYRRIGFREIADSVVYRFSQTSRTGT